MKKLLILASISALLAGCTSQNSGGTGSGAYGGTQYGAGRTELDTTPGANQKGAGAADLTGAQPSITAQGAAGTATPQAPGTGSGSGLGSASAQTSSTLSAADNQFIQQATQHGLAEVQMGQLIVQHAQSPDLKNFGQRLITDHTQANQQLAQIAAQKAVVIPTQADPTHQAMVDHLTSLSGTDFDRAVEKDAIRDHERDIRLYQQAANNLQDPDLKAFAQQTLPILQQHLDLAKQLQATTSGSQGGVGQ